MDTAHEILETIAMIEEYRLDIRTVTMGIGLLDCADPDPDVACARIRERIVSRAGRLVPVAEAFNDYVEDVAVRLRARGVRVEVDVSDDRFGKKIRNASKEKVPFTLIAGGEDAAAGAVSFRFRDGAQTNGVPLDKAVAHIVRVVDDRINDPAGERFTRD